MKQLALTASLILLNFLSGCTEKRMLPANHPKTFPLSAVRLLKSPFKHASEINTRYVMALDPDRLLAPFLIDAGLQPKAPRYGNWESLGLDGHTAGHYLTALALIVASQNNEEARQRLDYMISELAFVQQANGNGYLGGIPGGKAMWEEIAAGNINAGTFSLNDKWVPLYNIHKLFAGLHDAWVYAGNRQALDVLKGLSDFFVAMCSNLTDEQIQSMLISEHGGINEALANVYNLTGEEKYLELAKRMSHKAVLNPLLNREDQLTGLHANTQIPKVIGFMRIALLANKAEWEKASAFFWETVVKNRSVAIGGNSTFEHFHPANDFSSMLETREGPETCNTYNMMKLSKLLYQNSGNLKYIDFYERALYNHILSSQHPVHGGLVYFTPMRPGHYRVYSNPQETFWCCVGTGIENHAKYGELVYAHDNENIYVNLFIPSVLNWDEKNITITQNTHFPEDNKTTIRLKLAQPQEFTIFVRHPAWNNQSPLIVTVNGKKIRGVSSPGEYFSITRKWKEGDAIEVQFTMHTYSEFFPDNSPYMALLHGPIVLASPTDTGNLTGLIANDSRMGHIAHGPLVSREEAPLLIIDNDQWSDKIKPVANEPLTFSADELIYPASAKGLKLIPFYRLHDSRYMIYWEAVTSQKLAESKAEIQKREKEAMALEALTIDRIAPGQQQPESDRQIRFYNSETGIHQNRHWRHASGWFSYRLNDPNNEGKTLRITYYGLDAGRNFDIMLNKQLLATVHLDGSQGDKFFDVNYAIPSEIVNKNQNGKMELMFKAHNNSIAGGVYFIRLLR